MLRNYLVLFIRNLSRQKAFTFINLAGLTISMASTLLIFLYVRHEFSYDRFHHRVDRIFRINQTFIWGNNSENQFASTGPGVAYAIREEIPELELITSIHTPGNSIVSYTSPASEIIAFEEDRILAVDSNFFKVFNFPFVHGNAVAALPEANTLVMTKSTAKKYFGDENPVGRLVQLGGSNAGEQRTFEVTGVVHDTPDNSYIDFDILLSLKGFPIERFNWSWVWTQLETYIVLTPEADVEKVKARLTTIPRKHAAETLRIAFNTTYDDWIKSGRKWELFLQPMTDIHLPAQTVLNRINNAGNIQVVYSLIGAVIFIVLLSCINFMNLSAAQFTRRIRQASVRKILGLGKKGLSLGYFVEALAFCLASLVAGLAVSQSLLPVFNSFASKALTLDLLEEPALLGGLFALVLVMSIISSAYPAIFLSGFHPVEALKGRSRAGQEGRSFRNGLVVFQFAVSIILIVCTAVVFQQLNYVSEKDLGFNKENLVVLHHVETLRDGEALAEAASRIPGAVGASWCSSAPPTIWDGDSFNAEGVSKTFSLNFTRADEQYLPTLGTKLIVGRNFSTEFPGDVERVILNETAVRTIGWDLDDSVIGKKVLYDDKSWEVVGVVADFNYWSLTSPIEPLGIFHIKTKGIYPGSRQYIALRVAAQESDDWEATLENLQIVWKRYAGDSPFRYEFVDDNFANAFSTQVRFGKSLTVMAGLAILIASLGLLGMIIYSLEQRTKEIGIRKVSGASVWDILKLISGSYTRLIILAFVLAAPLSFWMMISWLEGFTYRITPSFWIFVATAAGTMCTAFLITSYHSFKAAYTNPVDVLKEE